uniref:hypothetical protein n=1 Tax=uncultured Caulobacter sp. TaxID=158749 RepID=UPI0025E1315D|nr:hypothetical protein [uncultured Caulobacter sp.]
MTDFYIHWNIITHKLRIHRGKCGACKDGRGMHEGKIEAGRGLTYDWVEAETYIDAAAQAADLIRRYPQLRKFSDKRDCGLCHPARNSN